MCVDPVNIYKFVLWLTEDRTNDRQEDKFKYQVLLSESYLKSVWV